MAQRGQLIVQPSVWQKGAQMFPGPPATVHGLDSARKPRASPGICPYILVKFTFREPEPIVTKLQTQAFHICYG